MADAGSRSLYPNLTFQFQTVLSFRSEAGNLLYACSITTAGGTANSSIVGNDKLGKGPVTLRILRRVEVLIHWNLKEHQFIPLGISNPCDIDIRPAQGRVEIRYIEKQKS